MLTAAQQSVAVLAYVKNRLITDQGDASLLQDPFFLANLDYNFAGLFEIYAGAHSLPASYIYDRRTTLIQYFLPLQPCMDTDTIALKVWSHSSEYWRRTGQRDQNG